MLPHTIRYPSAPSALGVNSASESRSPEIHAIAASTTAATSICIALI